MERPQVTKEGNIFNIKYENDQRKCYYCGGLLSRFPHPKRICPARGKECTACNRMDHTANICRNGRLQQRYDQRLPQHHDQRGQQSFRQAINNFAQARPQRYNNSLRESTQVSSTAQKSTN